MAWNREIITMSRVSDVFVLPKISNCIRALHHCEVGPIDDEVQRRLPGIKKANSPVTVGKFFHPNVFPGMFGKPKALMAQRILIDRDRFFIQQD